MRAGDYIFISGQLTIDENNNFLVRSCFEIKLAIDASIELDAITYSPLDEK